MIIDRGRRCPSHYLCQGLGNVTAEAVASTILAYREAVIIQGKLQALEVNCAAILREYSRLAASPVAPAQIHT